MEVADQVRHQIEQSGIIAAVRCRAPLDLMLEVGDALHATPVTAVMISAGSRQPWEIVAELRHRYGASMVVGAGPLATTMQAIAAVDAGAQFIATGGYATEIDDLCRRHHLLYMPGVSSVEEASSVLAAGVRVMSLFPARSLDVALFVQIAQAGATARMVAMGGVNVRNLGEYAQAGVSAVVVRGVIGATAQWRMHDAIVEMRRLRSVWAAQLEK
jgi:2-dehydro-3-deoxyphosphogluconate aldolase/(4S)-4-hydroxy-2-oxoglutarate aldolase